MNGVFPQFFVVISFTKSIYLEEGGVQYLTGFKVWNSATGSGEKMEMGIRMILQFPSIPSTPGN